MPRAMELVGRQREQAALGNAIAVAAEADGGILLIAGDAGGGETLRTRRGSTPRLPACGP
jgi:hypothetical protein